MKVEYPTGSVSKVTAPDPESVSPNKWYLGVDCASCGRRFAILEDASYGTIKYSDVATGDGKIQVSCPHCGEQHDYIARTLEQCSGS